MAAAESANNSAVHGALVPMLALGIPGSASTAVLLAALVLQGIRPGPMLMQQQPDLVWGLIASMFVGNVILLVMNLPLAPLFASLLRIPYAYLAPGILALSLVGAFATTLSLFTVGVALRLRRHRLSDDQGRSAAGAAGPRARARAADGDLPAPVADAVGRQPVDLRRAARSRRCFSSPCCCRSCGRWCRPCGSARGGRPSR